MTRGVSGVAFVLALVSCQPPQQAKQAQVGEAEEAVSLSPAEQLEQVRVTLDDIKSELGNEGKYSCCVFPTCNWCALHEGECSCFADVEAEEEVCPGCGLGWHNGNGMVDGVEASQVKWNIIHEH